jgi:hypothetical protein
MLLFEEVLGSKKGGNSVYMGVGCNRPAQNDEENLKNKTKKTIYDN